MRRRSTALPVFVFAVAAGGGWALDARAQAERSSGAGQADFWPVRGSVYMLAGVGGNVTASVGSDGVLLVDTGTQGSSDAVTAALARLQERLRFTGALEDALDGNEPTAAPGRFPAYAHAPPKPIRFIVNTSARLDHSGANAALAAARDSGPAATVIAHENVLIRLASGEALFERLPTETFASGEHNLGSRFNGEAIRIAHMPAAATDGDAIVHFRSADVISTGDVFSMEIFPVIDVDNGGSIDGVIRALNYVLNLAITGAHGEGGTLIIPGHGRLADAADVGRYRDMLTIIRDQMRSGVDAGLTLEQIMAVRPTLGYEGRFGANSGGWTTEMFLEAVYRSLTESPE